MISLGLINALMGGNVKFTSNNVDRNKTSGYVPNSIIRLRKWLRDEQRCLEIFNSKPPNIQMMNLNKKLYMQNRIEELKQEITKRGYSYEHGRGIY